MAGVWDEEDVAKDAGEVPILARCSSNAGLRGEEQRLSQKCAVYQQYTERAMEKVMKGKLGSHVRELLHTISYYGPERVRSTTIFLVHEHMLKRLDIMLNFM